MKKLEKTVLAFLCMIAVLLSSTNMLSIVQANTSNASSSEGFTYITVTDFGLGEENTYNDTGDAWSLYPTPLTNEETLYQKTFRAYVTFPTPEAHISYGVEDNWEGCRIYPDQNGAIVMKNASVDGSDTTFYLTSPEDGSFINQRILIKISAELDGDDVKITAAVNNFSEQTMCMSNGAEEFTNRLSAWSNSADGLKLEAYSEAAPDNLTQLGWKDFGIEENISCIFNSQTGNNRLDTLYTEDGRKQTNISFRGIVKFNRAATDDTLMLAFGAPSDRWGEGLRVSQTIDDTLEIEGIANSQGTGALLKIRPQDANITSFANQEFELGLDIWSENNTDLKVLVYVNGMQTTKVAGEWKGALPDHMQRYLYGYATDNSSIDIMPKEHSPQGLTKIGWKDFGIAESQTTFSYSDGVEGLVKKQNSNLTTLMDTSFRGVISFNNSAEGATELFYGYKDAGRQGIRIIPSGDNLEFLRVDGGNSTQMAEIPAAKVDTLSKKLNSEFTFGSFLNQEFELGIDLWQESESLKMNVFINGIQVIPTVSMRKAAVTSELTGNVITFVMQSKGDAIAVELPVEDSRNLVNIPTGYLLEGSPSYVRVNDDAASVGDSITTLGDHHILYVDADGVSAKDVGCYKPGDAHVDDTFDLRDVVAVTKVVTNQNVSSIARKKAADVNDDTDYTEADQKGIRNLLLGKAN